MLIYLYAGFDSKIQHREERYDIFGYSPSVFNPSGDAAVSVGGEVERCRIHRGNAQVGAEAEE